MPKTDNRTIGGKFEQEFAELLAKHGFWAHIMQQKKEGQPSDVIAVKGKFHTLIDCKVISDDRGFPFDRIEENQKYAMRMFHRRCGQPCYFALRLPDETIWLASLDAMETERNRGQKRLSEKIIRSKLWPLEKWLDASDVWAEDV